MLRGTSAVELVRSEEPFGRVRLDLQVDGTVASTLTIDRFEQFLGGELVPMDGIGNVETPAALRGRGHARSLLQLAVEQMQRGDAHLSMLYGIDHFYHRFGYESCGDEHWLSLPLPDHDRQRPVAPDGHEARAGTAADLDGVHALYDCIAAGTQGATARSVDGRTWAQLQRDVDAGDLLVLVDRSGSVSAYAWVARGCWVREERAKTNPDAFVLGEMLAHDEAAAAALIDATSAWVTGALETAPAPAREGGVDAGTASGQESTGAQEPTHVLVGVPPGHAVARAAERRPARFVREVRPDGGMMARVLREDLPRPRGCWQFVPDRF